MLEFFFKYFLVFPKIKIGGGDDQSGFGILIAEFFLAFYCLYLGIANKKLKLKGPLVILYTFVFYFIIVSSILQLPITGIFPNQSLFYFMRIVIYLGVFHFFYNYRTIEGERIVQRFFISPFKVQFYLGVLIVAIYYLTHSPTLNDMMWDYRTGLRLIPFAGLAIDTDSFAFLKPIGGGSGNLLCSWALAVLIITDNIDPRRAKKIILIVIAAALLTLSRGGLLTILLYVMYMGVRRNLITPRLIMQAAFSLIVVALIMYFTADKISIISNIFSRIEGTFQSGSLDPSSMGRIKNYIAVISAWIKSPFYIVFGLGYDETILEYHTKQTIVESFLLQVIVSSGVIGVVLLSYFYYLSYQLSKINVWFNSLWKFLIFESILQWSVTGGDFFSAHVLFVILALLGLGYRQIRISKNETIN